MIIHSIVIDEAHTVINSRLFWPTMQKITKLTKVKVPITFLMATLLP
jgi:superfamily II DNA helicase RecQ